MTDGQTGSRWRLHVALVAGLAVCVVGFTVELRRGMDGHWGAWAYVLEWPLFAVAGTFIWWRLLHADDAPTAPTKLPANATERAPTVPTADDQDLRAWQAYVERLNASEEHRTDRPDD